MTARLIDEWQVVPAIWNHVRRAVDARRKPGQFMLTGSAVPADDVTRHTGAGRS
jgi:predicted AAA+ superfamily ATPase